MMLQNFWPIRYSRSWAWQDQTSSLSFISPMYLSWRAPELLSFKRCWRLSRLSPWVGL